MNERRAPDDGPQQVFIGDVQGCSEELAELLGRLDSRFGDDYVVYLAGDLINRGPSNLPALESVLRLQQDGRASFVLGNHEISLLRVAYALRPLGEFDSFGDVLESSSRDDWLAWLRRQSLVECGDIAGHPFAMVHASAAPSWTRDELARRARRIEQRLAKSDEAAAALLAASGGGAEIEAVRDDLGRMTRCRSVSGDAWSSEEPGGEAEAWHTAWSRANHDYGIVYGHWARQRLHVALKLRGLDTGCVHHGRGSDGFLTAWLPGNEAASGAAPFDVPDDRFLQVRARRRYYRR
jgi:bis(5'-nucleosyl)-tetraphosphatase (symmetrical)